MSELQEHKPPHQPENPNPPPPPPRRKGGFLSFRQLIFLAVMVFLAAKGLAGLGDIAFVVFSYVYIYMFLPRIAFPRKQTEQKSKFSNPNNKLFRAYFHTTAVIGLLFPICYIAEGIFRGDAHGARAAGSHLFLLCGQALFEPVGFSDKFSMPIGILGPVFYNARRIFALLDWLKFEFSETQQRGPMRLYEGRVIASVNTALWFFNLFGLLLPVYLPRACEIYFSENKGD